MTDGDKALYDHILQGYQNKLASAEFNFLKEQALSTQKDRRIAELTEALDDERKSR